jgi:hypothetical protein
MAKDRASQNGHEMADFRVSSPEDFSSSEPFDFVIGRYVLIHQPSPSAFIRAARRYVQKGGVIAFQEISLHRGYHCLPPTAVWEQMASWLNIGFQTGAPSWDAAGRLIPGSVVNFTLFLQKWPKIQHSSPECLHQSLDFHKRSFSPPGVLIYESDGVSHHPPAFG